jgi:hypothetical protein
MKRLYQQLLSLVRAGIGASGLDSSLFRDEVNWREIYSLSESQGVLAISFDGLQQLPKDPLPEMDFLMDWLGQTSYAESLHDHHKVVLNEVRSLLCPNTLDILLLKGIGLSHYYPITNHRPVGDIDIYTYGRHSEVDNLFASKGFQPRQTVEKH